MNNSAAKVGEIFREAGTAFNKLSEMTLMLQPMDDSSQGGKWSDEEVEMLRGCINRFAVELNKISQHIKNRTMSHLRRLLEMDSGIILDISHSPPSPSQPLQHLQLLPAHHLQGQQAQQLPAGYLQGIHHMQVNSLQQQPPVPYVQEQQVYPFFNIPLQPLAPCLQHQVSVLPQLPPVYYPLEQHACPSTNIPPQPPVHYLQQQACQQNTIQHPPANLLLEQYPLQVHQPPVDYLREHWTEQHTSILEPTQPFHRVPEPPPAAYMREQYTQPLHREQPPADYLPDQYPAIHVSELQHQQMPSIPLEQSPTNYLGKQHPQLRRCLMQPPANYACERQPQQLHCVPERLFATPPCEEQPQQVHNILDDHPAKYICGLQPQTSKRILQELQELRNMLKNPTANYRPEPQPQQMHSEPKLSSANYLEEQQPQLRRLLRQPPANYLSEEQSQQIQRVLEQSSKDYISGCGHLKNKEQQPSTDYLREKQLSQMHSTSEQSSANYLRDQCHIPMPSQAEKLSQKLPINIYSQGFPVNSRDDDVLLRNFDPSIVPLMPPANFMEEDIIPPLPSEEFEDTQDTIVHNTLLVVPGLIRSLDTDQCTNSTDSSEANISTIQTELPSHGGNQEAATGAFEKKDAHFSLRQAKETWSHVTGPVDQLEKLSTGQGNKRTGNVTNTRSFSCISRQKDATINQTNEQLKNVAASPGKPVDNASKTDNISSIESEEKPVAKFTFNGAFSEIFNNKISIIDPKKSAKIPTPVKSTSEVAKNIFFVESEEKPADKSFCNGSFSAIFRQKNISNDQVINIQAPIDRQVSSAPRSPDKNEEKLDGKCSFNGACSIFRPNSSINDPTDPTAFEPNKTINHTVSEGRPVGPVFCHNSSAVDVLIGEPIITSSDSCDAICFNENRESTSMSHCFHSVSATKFPSFFGAPANSVTEKERTLRELCYFLYKVPFKSIFNKLLATTIANGLTEFCPDCFSLIKDDINREVLPSNAPHTKGSSELANEKPTDATPSSSSSVRADIDENALQSNAHPINEFNYFSSKQPTISGPSGFSPMTDPNNNKDLTTNTSSTNESSDLSNIKPSKPTTSSFSSVKANINEEALPSNARRINASSYFTSELPAISTLGCFSSVKADTIKEDLPSNAPSTESTRGRGRPRRPRRRPKVDCTAHESAVVSSATLPLVESTPGPSQTRLTRSRRNQACNGDETVGPAPKKRSRKKDPTVTASGRTTRASRQKKQLK